MKKIALLLALALALGGCAKLKPLVGWDNPVTPQMMYQVEQTAVVVVSGLNAYRSLCVQKIIDQKCRDVIVQIQSFTRPAAKQLVTLRRYFKNNDRINAINAYNTLVALLADARAVAKQHGVTVQ